MLVLGFSISCSDGIPSEVRDSWQFLCGLADNLTTQGPPAAATVAKPRRNLALLAHNVQTGRKIESDVPAGEREKVKCDCSEITKFSFVLLE